MGIPCKAPDSLLDHRFGSHFQKMAAVANPNPLTASTPEPRPAAPAMADASSGPPQLPISVMKRHKPRNCGRPSAGEASAPMVMTSPEPSPLPSPSNMVASRKGQNPSVSGISSSATPMTNMDGVATQRRPYWSMILPAG